MANSNGKIYRDTTTNPPIGIDPWGDVAYVLGRNTGDWGQLCGDVDENGNDVNKVNSSSVNKPYRSASLATLETGRAAANFGWDITKKAAGTATSSFITTLKNKGVGGAFWAYNKPRGKTYSEEFRIRDFEDYNHGELPFRHPVT